MANIPPVYKAQAHNGMTQQHSAAGAGSAGEQGGKRHAPQQEKKKKIVLTPLENSGTIYRPNGRPAANRADDETDSRI